MSNEQLAVYISQVMAQLQKATDEIRAQLPDDIFAVSNPPSTFAQAMGITEGSKSYPILQPLNDILDQMDNDVDTLRSRSRDSSD
jgi:hypothetical protein